jgi:hypothetical protein
MAEHKSESVRETINPTKCWAACLGNCSDKMSREHLITKAITLDNEVSVLGMPWCAHEFKKVGLASLTAKILCRFHNSALSEVDEEAVRFVEGLREAFRLLAVRYTLKPRRWSIKRFYVDGPKMERWFLKTLINVACYRGSPIGPDSQTLGLPSKALVEIAFGRKAFEPNAGLYGIFDAPEKRPHTDGISILAFNTRANHVLGAVFSFLGFRLMLYLDKNGPKQPFMEIGTATGALSEVIEPCYHPEGITYRAGKGTSHAVTFEWH